MDKTVLLEKRKNLLNEESTSDELYLNNDFVDITKFIPTQTLIDFIFNDNLNQIFIFKGTISQNVKNEINSIDKPEKLLKYCELNDIKISKPENVTNSSLDEYKRKYEKEIIEEKFKALDNLVSLGKRSLIENYDTSIWKLFLSYGFLYGVSTYPNKDEKLLKAPLINIEINIQQRDDGSIVLSKWNDGNIVQNEVLFNFLEDQYDIKIDPQLLINIDQQFDSNQYFEKIKEICVDTTICDSFEKFTKTKKEPFIREFENKLFIKKMLVISLINPVGGKLLRDYDKILKEEYSFPTVDTIFSNNLNGLIYEKDNLLEINNSLNLSQKLAIVNSLTKNLLIFGPPGTGKSEVVINIIANALAANKNMLIVSEKKAALDVIFERLGVLNKLIMSAFNNKNKDIFYENIIAINKAIIFSNPVNITLKNELYLQIFNYYTKLNSILVYKDKYGGDIKSFIESYSQIDLKEFQKHQQTIFELYKLTSLSTNYLQQFTQIQNFYKVYTDLKQLIPNISFTKQIFNKKSISEFLACWDNNEFKNSTYSLIQFLVSGKIIKKRPLFFILAKENKNVNFNNVIDCLCEIKDKDLFYIENAKEFIDFLNNEPKYMHYLIYFDWIANTKILDLINSIKSKNNINKIIHYYWESKFIRSKTIAQILFDFYTFELKNKLLRNKELDRVWTKIVRIANLSRRPSIAKVIKNNYEILRIIFPVWIQSPDSAAITIPLNKGEFDIGIFDESSQMRIERGIPLVYRCKNSIVSGDDKQLKPTNFFLKINELGEVYEGHLDNVDSLLDKAKSSNWMSFTLMNHYRSTNEELIHFSNKHFYNNKLQCITKNKCFNQSIETIDLDATYNRKRGINEGEANKVVQILSDTYTQYKSIIIITFNQKQAEHIELLINQNPKIAKLVDENVIKIRSLENVQGDEGDLVIISTTFGRDSEGKFIQNFGPVNQNGGMNRINVMITRAKNKMVIIKSFKSSDITNLDNENTKVLHDFFQYVEQIQSGINVLLEETQTSNLFNTYENEELSQIFKELCDEILPSYPNIEIKQNEYIGSNKIDLIIRDINTKEVKLFLIFDSQSKLNEYQANHIKLIQNIDQQKYFEDRQYRTIRINSFEWAIDKKNIVQTIINCL